MWGGSIGGLRIYPLVLSIVNTYPPSVGIINTHPPPNNNADGHQLAIGPFAASVKSKCNLIITIDPNIINACIDVLGPIIPIQSKVQTLQSVSGGDSGGCISLAGGRPTLRYDNHYQGYQGR